MNLSTATPRSKRVAELSPKPKPAAPAPVAAKKKAGKKIAKKKKAVKEKTAKRGVKKVKETKTKTAARKPAKIEYDVDSIVDSKLVRKKRFYLVHWVGYDNKQNTWEPEEHLGNAQEKIQEFDVKYPDKP
ncbi:hypothetical protein HYALB_00009371 [Hymenoscyphus albidus]|uniref:Chromo domain-containing protein n=1 Tax=Hymenoscyphus albidus TaxID=595503 RepID=A0A9N9Q358_9HELO|nr:hypothetical protein HYALB_00009371 [Hymenoscyphus albidus]